MIEHPPATRTRATEPLLILCRRPEAMRAPVTVSQEEFRLTIFPLTDVRHRISKLKQELSHLVNIDVSITRSATWRLRTYAMRAPDVIIPRTEPPDLRA